MWRQGENCSTVNPSASTGRTCPGRPQPARVCLKKFTNSFSELRIGPQAVELLRRVFLSSHHGRLAEAGSDIVKRPALGLWHFEVGEDEEYEQQHDEDDVHIGT